MRTIGERIKVNVGEKVDPNEIVLDVCGRIQVITEIIPTKERRVLDDQNEEEIFYEVCSPDEANIMIITGKNPDGKEISILLDKNEEISMLIDVI